MAKKQRAGNKKIKKCALIIGKPVLAVFMNGTMPHGIAIAMTGKRDGYLVNLKEKKFIEYLKDGKFVIHRYIDSRIKVKRFVETQAESNPDTSGTLYDKYTQAANSLAQECNEETQESRFDHISDDLKDLVSENTISDWSGLT